MNKKMIKTIGVLAVTALSVSALAIACACGGEPEKPEATIEVTGLEVVYDGTNREVGVTVAPEAAKDGEVSVSYFAGGQEVYQCVNAGSYTVKVEFTSETYKSATLEKTLVISPKTLTLSGVNAFDVYYDGTNIYDASIFTPSYADEGHYNGELELTGAIEGDEVSLKSLMLLADTSAYGKDRSVEVNATLEGSSAANYKVAVAEELKANVYPVHGGFGLLPQEDESGKIVSYTVGRYVGKETTAVIPSAYNNIPVTATSNYLFVDNWLKVNGEAVALTSVTVPASITKIGYAFAQNNTTLKTLIFEDRTTPIDWQFTANGVWTVAGCTAIETITFGKGFGNIPRAFAQNSAIKSVNLTNVTGIGDFAFAWTQLTSVTIPASVTSMGTAVFQDCGKLKTAIFEDRDTTIDFALGDMEGSWIFFLCNLDELVIGSGITKLPHIFAPTSVLTVRLGKDVTALDLEAFPWGKTVTKLYLDSQTVCNGIKGYMAYFENAVIYLKDNVTASAYLTENYTIDSTDTTEGYVKYVKNAAEAE